MLEIVFEDLDGTLVPLVLDAAVEEQHRANAIATEHEVERGVSTSDHVRPERRVLTIDVRISDTPVASTSALGVSLETVDLDLPPRLVTEGEPQFDGRSWAGSKVGQQAAPPTKLSVWTPETPPKRVADAWALLMDARERSLLATVTTGWETYEDMVLLEVLATRAAEDGSWLRASLTFAELRMVSTQLVADPVPARPRDRRQVDRGSQEAQEAPPRLRSLLSRGLDAVFGDG